MPALTTERLSSFYGLGPAIKTIGMRAGVKIFKGAMVGIDSSGNAMPAGLLAGGTVRVVGVANATFDNTSGAAGAVEVEVTSGVWKFANLAADLIGRAAVGSNCFVVDDNTVSLTNGTNTRPVAGRVDRVDSDGVRVWFA